MRILCHVIAGVAAIAICISPTANDQAAANHQAIDCVKTDWCDLH